MTGLIWIHDDCLSAKAAVFSQTEDPAVYVFDDAFMAKRGYGLKRLTFIYECLLDMPVELYRGPCVETLLALARRDGRTTIRTMETPDPFLRNVMNELADEIDLSILTPPPFTTLTKKPNLKRFSRYWKMAQETAFLPTDKQS